MMMYAILIPEPGITKTENSSLISDQSVIKSLQTIHVSNFLLI